MRALVTFGLPFCPRGGSVCSCLRPLQRATKLTMTPEMPETSTKTLQTTDHYNVFGIPFCTLTQRETLQRILDLRERDKASSVIFANAHVVVEANQHPGLKAALNLATLVVPDGVPITWVLKGKGQNQTERYSGPDLMEDVFRFAPEAKHFFLGSTLETLEKIKMKFNGHAVGFYSPPFTKDTFSDEEKLKQIKMIEDSGADFIWVGLGAPKQEYFVTELASKASKGVFLAVGAAFDFYAGNKPRAPKTLQKMGLEWAFRLASEPRRLAKRYLTTNPAFIKLALEELLKTPENQ
jgi:N-acetylglucosaminyldiphosphoundecaprenol N-acetyl-beta-D-mannosaminyltransferase